MTVCFIQLAQAVKIAGLSLSVNFQTEETTIGEQFDLFSVMTIDSPPPLVRWSHLLELVTVLVSQFTSIF